LPVLSNSRHEKFAQGLAEGKTATEAYENAGYAPNDGNSARLKGNERIRARVAELQGRGAERAAVTLQGLLDEASDIQDQGPGKGTLCGGCRCAHGKGQAFRTLDRSLGEQKRKYKLRHQRRALN
jgi:hypothetical protein